MTLLLRHYRVAVEQQSPGSARHSRTSPWETVLIGLTNAEWVPQLLVVLCNPFRVGAVSWIWAQGGASRLRHCADPGLSCLTPLGSVLFTTFASFEGFPQANGSDRGGGSSNPRISRLSR